MPERYRVGPSMAVDWGEAQPELRRGLLGRVFRSFIPYWWRGMVALACMGVVVLLGLVPALVRRG